MAQWTSRIETIGGWGGLVGVRAVGIGTAWLSVRGWGETRVRNVYSDRTIRYNTRAKRTRARFLRSMNRSLLAIRFACIRIACARGAWVERREISGRPFRCTFNTLFTVASSARGGPVDRNRIWLKQCQIYRIRSEWNLRFGVPLLLRDAIAYQESVERHLAKGIDNVGLTYRATYVDGEDRDNERYKSLSLCIRYTRDTRNQIELLSGRNSINIIVSYYIYIMNRTILILLIRAVKIIR